MSTYWHVRCIDCKETHRFDDANHADEFMLAICRNPEAIASLVELVQESQGSIRLNTVYGDIDPTWFRKHMGHQLLPIDEYGHVYGGCTERFTCGECDTTHWCGLQAHHDGPHQRRRR